MTSTNDTESLRDRLSSLPQELYDTIYDFTFTVPEDEQISVVSFRVPAILQVKRAHRQRLRKQYFKSNTFVVTDDTSRENRQCLTLIDSAAVAVGPGAKWWEVLTIRVGDIFVTQKTESSIDVVHTRSLSLRDDLGLQDDGFILGY